ncbi:MAG: hypothetical protein QW767_03110 [Thermoprotei archaeon]
MEKVLAALIAAALILSLGLNVYFILLYERGGVRGESFVVWNVETNVQPGKYLFSTMFDTFRMHIALSANSTIYVYVMTPSQYAEFQSTGKPVGYVAKYSGDKINVEWNLSTGCAGYLWIIYNPLPVTVAVKPDVVATYSPSPNPTGACA